jgi:hypothetical protein
MRRALIPTLSIALASLIVAGACSLAGRVRPAPIESGVLEAVRVQDSVAVMVMLVPPSGGGQEGEAVQRDIRRAQDDVLDGLDPESYRILKRFESVPAMTLVVYGERAVQRLARQERVERVGLDDGGGGGAP